MDLPKHLLNCDNLIVVYPSQIKPNIIFFKPVQIVRQKRCYVEEGEFKIEHHTKIKKKKKKKIMTSRDCEAHKKIWS